MQRSFYYWRSVLRLSPAEQETLQHLAVDNLYVKFFDVDWEGGSNAAKPVAKIAFPDSLPRNLRVTPVVFLTQEPLRRLDTAGLKNLATNIAALLANTASTQHLPLSNEVQVDCDWTQTTRDHYFFLLNRLKQEPFFRGKTVSATVRLHQLKFISQNGVPPVDKGLLMCYNMGNLRYPQTKNSIIDETELAKYINRLETYPLPLDVALPVFDWYVLFDGPDYKGLVREFDPGPDVADKQRIVFTADTVINGYAFKKGQWLRHETSEAGTVKKCAERVSQKLKAAQLTVILYHLDEGNLTKYNLHELESFYRSFR